jgi:hypothetical protein
MDYCESLTSVKLFSWWLISSHKIYNQETIVFPGFIAEMNRMDMGEMQAGTSFTLLDVPVVAAANPSLQRNTKWCMRVSYWCRNVRIAAA